MSRVLICLACLAVFGGVVSLALADDEDDEAHRRDLRELIRRGGTLPEGYEPEGGPTAAMPSWWRHGSGVPSLTRVSGRIVKRYLALEEGDSARAAVYRDALAILAEVLLETAPDDPRGTARLGRALMPLLISGLEDEQGAPACAEIMEIVQGGPTAPTFELGGAQLEPTPDGLLVRRVPAGSAAAEMTLREGDRLLLPPSGLEQARRALEDGDKLTVRVLRKDGVVEKLEVELSRHEESR